jgi:hypothetical protein
MSSGASAKDVLRAALGRTEQLAAALRQERQELSQSRTEVLSGEQRARGEGLMSAVLAATETLGDVLKSANYNESNHHDQ